MSESIFPTAGFSCVGSKDVSGYFTPPTPGLTKRELFAAMAMQGLMVRAIPGGHNSNTTQNNEETVRHAVCVADRLLKALAKSEELGE